MLRVLNGGESIKPVSRFKGVLSLLFGLLSIFSSLSFWSGIGSLFLTFYAIPFSVFGIFLARSCLKEAQDRIASAGLVTSVFGFLLNIATFIAFLILFR